MCILSAGAAFRSLSLGLEASGKRTLEEKKACHLPGRYSEAHPELCSVNYSEGALFPYLSCLIRIQHSAYMHLRSDTGAHATPRTELPSIMAISTDFEGDPQGGGTVMFVFSSVMSEMEIGR